MAQAVCSLFGPGVKYAIGPALMDDFQYGFYYDFDLPDGVSISSEDLPKIEAEMKKIASEKFSISRLVLPSAEARNKMQEIGQDYKAEMIDDLLTGENPPETVRPIHSGRFHRHVSRPAPAQYRQAGQGV